MADLDLLIPVRVLRFFRASFRGILVFALGGFLAIVGQSVYEYRRETVVYHTVVDQTDTGATPGWARLHYDRTRSAVCPTRITRALIRFPGATAKDPFAGPPDIVPLGNESGTVYLAAGRRQFNLFVSLPPGLPAGPWPWYIKSVAFDMCHPWSFLTNGEVRVSPLTPLKPSTTKAATEEDAAP